MFEKFNQFAEAAATNVSRRQMLGRLGRAAAAAAAALAGLLPLSAEAGRGHQLKPCHHCTYGCPDGSSFVVTRQGGCPGHHDECDLVSKVGCERPGF